MVPEKDKSLFRLMFGEIDEDVAIGIALSDPGLWETAEVHLIEGEVKFHLRMHSQYVNRLHRHYIYGEKDETNSRMEWVWFECPPLFEDAFRSLVEGRN